MIDREHLVEEDEREPDAFEERLPEELEDFEEPEEFVEGEEFEEPEEELEELEELEEIEELEGAEVAAGEEALEELAEAEEVETGLDEILRERLGVFETGNEEEEEGEGGARRPPEAEEEAVAPRHANEFVCRSCFLIKPRSQLADPIRSYCVDCANQHASR